MEDEQGNNQDNQSLESLDAPDTTVISSDNQLESPDSGGSLASPAEPDGEQPKPPKQHGFLHGANLYLAIFILLVLIGIGAVIFAFTRSSNTVQPNHIASQDLSPDTLKQLAGSSTIVGNSDQVLTIQSNAILSGQVLAQKNLEVAGDLKIGGNLSLPSVVVAGTSQFGSIQVNKDFTAGGNGAIQGNLTVKNSLSVNGGGNFSGPLTASQISANSLQLTGDLKLTHHISAGGGTPGSSRGSAVGSGGSASVSGSDTAGSITISTGSNPPAGCFITLNFAQAFHATPHIIVTPIGSSASQLAWYVNRSTTSMSVCTTSTPPAHANFGFDYLAFD